MTLMWRKTNMAKTLVDFILPEDYDRYNELLDMAQEAKANAPKKERTPRGPLTREQKIARKEKSIEAAKRKLEELLAMED